MENKRNPCVEIEANAEKKRDLNFCHVYDARQFFTLVAGANENRAPL